MSKPKETPRAPQSAAKPDADAIRRANEDAEKHKAEEAARAAAEAAKAAKPTKAAKAEE